MTTTSKNIDGVQELTLIANLKSGLVPCVGQTLSYGSRLRLLFEALFEQRKTETEAFLFEPGLLESLQVLRFVRWALVDDDTKLMLAVSFDGPWEPYIRKIVEDAGPMLDVIFCHCDDYAGNSCADGYVKFAAWVRRKQVDVPFIYAADADLTVDDVRYLKNFERAAAGGGTLAELTAAPYTQSRQPLVRAYALFKLRALFPNVGDPSSIYTDEAYFDVVSILVMQPDFKTLLLGAQMLGKSGVALGLREAALQAWLGDLILRLAPELAANQLKAAPAPKPLAARGTVQGNVLTSYKVSGGMTHGCFALVRFKDAPSAKRLLGELASLVTCEPTPELPQLPPVTFNLGLTLEGLRTLGLNKEERARFPKEFQEGLEARAGLLGDVGWNHPENWQLPEANWPMDEGSGDPLPLSLVDAVFFLQTCIARKEGQPVEDTDYKLTPALNLYLKELLNKHAPNGELEIMHVQATRRFDDKGHLGSFDGASQPFAKGEPIPERMAARDEVPLGELLLGYPNARGESGNLPIELNLNSTFMALRNMAQDPAIYDLLRAENKLDLALGRDAKGGNPFDHEPTNAFTFEPGSDQKCPVFSHIRRANPRNPPPHAPPRILRRGMSYGPRWKPDSKNNIDDKRGVMFLAFAASLADQYEVVQRWVNGGNSTGVLSAHPDLVAGTFRPGTKRTLQYRTPTGTDTIVVPPRPAATLRWGLYAFIPSTSAMLALVAHTPGKFLAPAVVAPPKPALPLQNGAPQLSAEGETVAAQLEDIFRLENIQERLMKVAKAGGVVREPEYATLAVSRQLVATMLSKPDAYSVRSYWARMSACSATMYLGMDPNPKPLSSDEYTEQVRPGDHGKESHYANQFISGISFEDAFAKAKLAADAWFEEQDLHFEKVCEVFENGPAALRPEPVLDLQALAARVIRDVASQLYGIPEGLLSDDLDLNWPGPARSPGALRCPVDLTSVFAHVFPPRPTAAVSADAKRRGVSTKQKVMTWYQTASEKEKLESPLIQAVSQSEGQTEDFVQRSIIGLLSGFAVPTNGSLLSVLKQLVENDTLWRLQRIMPDIQVDGVGHSQLRENLTPIMEQIYAFMINAPIPSLVHRTALDSETLGTGPNAVQVQPNDLIALHLGAAANEAMLEKATKPWKFLFGDLPDEDKKALGQPVHACPGQAMAFGVIAGTVVALLAQKRLKKVALDPFVLSKYLPDATLSER